MTLSAKSLTAAIILLAVLTAPAVAKQQSYSVKKITAHLYAAIALPGSTATSNAFFYIGNKQVVAGGAHMTEKATADLFKAINDITDRPVDFFILPHHHPGYSNVDFYFPEEVKVITTYPTWQSLNQERTTFPNEALLFNGSMTLEIGGRVIVTSIGKGHSAGDALAFFPDENAVFTSDLLYFDNVGFMGEGYMQEWMNAVAFIQQIGADNIIPGHGQVSNNEALSQFKIYFRNFLDEVSKHIEAGDSLEKTKREFSLPRYRHLTGYDQLLEQNIERAYINLKETAQAR